LGGWKRRRGCRYFRPLRETRSFEMPGGRRMRFRPAISKDLAETGFGW
jgi:hypothetical protein